MRAAVSLCLLTAGAGATPANKKALANHYEHLLPERLNDCTTCHRPSAKAAPQNLDEFPHNAFGDRLRRLGEELKSRHADAGIGPRLEAVALEDCDGDGVGNLAELLLGSNPGDATIKPNAAAVNALPAKFAAWKKFNARYRWEPFKVVRRPSVPAVADHGFRTANPIDAFIDDELAARGMTSRPEADKATLLRRLHLDLTGLAPSPEEIRAFIADRSGLAYERVVDRLLGDARHGQRWARHWMDVWRYSDVHAYTTTILQSQPHIWRWRDWIVESINADKGYDRMLVEMLAADEAEPENLDALRATGFLARSYHNDRAQWIENVVEHTSKAFLGVTMNCAKCHDHKFDPVSQQEYYGVRAVFEGYNVRVEPVPGMPDTAKDGIVRAFDSSLNPSTYLLDRGDDRYPRTDKPVLPGVPGAFGGSLDVQLVNLPMTAKSPDKRAYVKAALLDQARRAVADAKQDVSSEEKRLRLQMSEAKLVALRETLSAEELEDRGMNRSSASWKAVAERTCAAQLDANVLEAKYNLVTSESALVKCDADVAQSKDSKTKSKAAKAKEDAAKKLDAARKAVASAEKAKAAGVTAAFKPRELKVYPGASSGRRLAFAKWLTSRENPLAARVAVNHIWLRHFGRGIVATPEDFGANGRKATHPALLDWLAAELMENGWSMKHIHRLIVTSNAYRRAGTTDANNAGIDPDNTWYWKMPGRRMEGEVVRDNLLLLSGRLDETMSGADLDVAYAESNPRRSLYFRESQEKNVEFVQIFDGPRITECYQRESTIKPHQALALLNSKLAIESASILEGKLSGRCGADYNRFIEEAFLTVLGRFPKAEEARLCAGFVERDPGDPAKARRQLVGVLFNHHEFVTIR